MQQQDVTEKLERFRESIMRQAKEQMEEIHQELEVYRSSQLDRYQEETEKDFQSFVGEETRRIEGVARETVAARRAQLRQALYQRRNELTQGLFLKVRREVQEFALSQDYPAYLLEKARHAAGLSSQVVLLVREQDQGIVKGQGLSCQIEVDSAIELGGLRYRLLDLGMEGDETLDGAVEAQREWFYENCGLYLE